MRLGIALRAFFAALFDQQKATWIARVLDGQPLVPAEVPPKPEPAEPPRPPARDPAVTLLATLQREARLVDLVREDLNRYSDAQVGAAARPCLQQCREVLDRLFELQPLVEVGEGATIEVGGDVSPMRYQWVGEGTSATAKVVHHGWQAAKVELPRWTGSDEDARVIAPAQVQTP